MSKFIEIDPMEIEGNVFQKISRDWMLITAGKQEKLNTMTASWGGMGVLWNANVVFAFVRPTRYTFEFLEKEPCFSLSFLGADHRKALQICGAQSGRDTNKIADAGLTPLFDAPAPYFAQASLALVCRKLYTSDLDPAAFLDPTLQSHYKAQDYHRMYVGEITKTLLQIET